MVVTITVTTKFIVIAVTTKLVVTAVMMKLVFKAVTTKLVYFFQCGHKILKLCFGKIQGISCIFQILMEFWAQIMKICKIDKQS